MKRKVPACSIQNPAVALIEIDDFEFHFFRVALSASIRDSQLSHGEKTFRCGATEDESAESACAVT